MASHAEAQKKAKAALEKQLASLLGLKRPEHKPTDQFIVEPKKKRADDGPQLTTKAPKSDKSLNFTVKIPGEPPIKFDVITDKKGNVTAAKLPKTDPPFDPKSHKTWDKDTIKAHAAVMKAVPDGKLQGLSETTLSNAAGFIAATKAAGKDPKDTLGCIEKITDKAGNEYAITKDGDLKDSNDNTYKVDKEGNITKDGATFDPSAEAGLEAVSGAGRGMSGGGGSSTDEPAKSPDTRGASLSGARSSPSPEAKPAAELK